SWAAALKTNAVISTTIRTVRIMNLMPSNKRCRITKRAVFASGDRKSQAENQVTLLRDVKEILLNGFPPYKMNIITRRGV
ncbi:MAG: hypothetical protein K8I82_13125, partial [Anaerolineae bacterium]|nr:hypothetical protein [Anaerolineae bacterium]